MLDGGTARQVGRGHPIEIGFRARHGTPRGKKKTIDTFVYVAPPLSTVRSTASQIWWTRASTFTALTSAA